MENFSILGSLALRLHQEFVNLYYVLLPIFFCIAIVVDWVRHPTGSQDFLDTLRRAIVATLLVVSFPEVSDAILAITSGIASKISDLTALDSFYRMAGEKVKTYTFSTNSLIFGTNDLIVATISFCSYYLLFIARYVTLALYHFMWIFLSILAPILILFNLFRGTSQITVNLYKSLVEVASYKIVWAILSAMLQSLAFGQTYRADGRYLTVTVMNFVIAAAMLATPLIIKSVVGPGLSSVAESLGMAATVMMATAPVRVANAVGVGAAAITHPVTFVSHVAGRVRDNFSYPMTPLPPSSRPPPSTNRV